MNAKLKARFSIWDKGEAELFDTYSYSELINEIGKFSAPLRQVGESITVNGKKEK